MQNMLIRMAGKYALDRLGESSTWAAIAAALATQYHVNFSNSFVNSFVGAGVAVSALIAIVVKDGWQKKVQ